MNLLEIDSIVDVLRRRWLVVAIVLVATIAALPLVLKYLPTYKATAKLLIISQANRDTTQADPDLPSIVTSTEVLSRVIKRLKLDATPYTLGKSVKTLLPARSSTLELSVSDREGARAATIANAIADEACVYYRQVTTLGYVEAAKLLSTRIADARLRFASSNARLQHASETSMLGTTDKSVDDVITQLDAYRVQRVQVASALAADRATSAALRHQLQRISPIVKGEILEKDVVYREFQSGVAKDNADLNSERATFRDSFPGLMALKHRVERERTALDGAATDAMRDGAGLSLSQTQTVLDQERAAGTEVADRARLNILDSEIVAERQRFERLSGASATVGALRAQRDAALQQYLTLAQRLGVSQGDEAQASSLGTLIVVSRAFAGPSQVQRIAPAIAVLLIVLALGAALLVEMLDRRFWTARDLGKVYRRPVLFEFRKNG